MVPEKHKISGIIFYNNYRNKMILQEMKYLSASRWLKIYSKVKTVLEFF